MLTDDVTFSGMDEREKFDIQLSQAKQNEVRLARIFDGMKIERVELKSESHQWEQTGNICIEYQRTDDDGTTKKTGIAVTEADWWCHELKREGRTLLYLWLPVPRLKELCRAAFKAGMVRHHAGDGERQSVILLRLSDLLG